MAALLVIEEVPTLAPPRALIDRRGFLIGAGAAGMAAGGTNYSLADNRCCDRVHWTRAASQITSSARGLLGHPAGYTGSRPPGTR
jgi:hypothetical protein